MWERVAIKEKAKEQMKGRYFKYLGVTLIPMLIAYVANFPVSLIGNLWLQLNIMTSDIFDKISDIENQTAADFDFDLITELSVEYLRVIILPMMFIFIITMIIEYFVGLPVNVGMRKWFLRSREASDMPVSLCFASFKKGVYLKTVWSMFYYNFFLTLWSMLFVIPGIIKFYSYRMIPFIIADNPNIGAKKALKLSCEMTKGHKLSIFVLDLSFLGWYALGFLACFIGIYAVIPYHYAALTELYDVLKTDAVDKELCTMEDLGYEQV